jgi:hypothetical protein
MKLKAPLWLCVALPLWLGGCLLPQPDTPPIGPGYTEGAQKTNAGPITPPQGVSQGAATHPGASAAPTADANPAPSPTPAPDRAATDAPATGPASPSPTPAS